MKTCGNMELAVSALLKRELSFKVPSSQYGLHAQPFKDTVTKMLIC